MVWPAFGAPSESCGALQRGCAAQCDETFPKRLDDMGHAGCLTRCSWDATTCAARRAIDDGQATLERDLTPWLSDQASRWQRFIDGFRRGRPDDLPEPPRANPFHREPAPERGTSL